MFIFFPASIIMLIIIPVYYITVIEHSTPSSSPPPDMTVYIKEEPEDEGEDITVKDEPLCSEEYAVIFLT